MTSQADEPTLADVQRQFPRWRCWRAISGMYYARRANALPEHDAAIKGEDPIDLRDQIIRAASQDEDGTNSVGSGSV